MYIPMSRNFTKLDMPRSVSYSHDKMISKAGGQRTRLEGMSRISSCITFCRVIDSGSFSLAAKALGVSQSAVSQQIKRLEQEYGARLLHREGTSVVPTEEGQIIYDFAMQIVKLYERSKQSLRDNADAALSGRLTIGASTGLGEYLLPAVLTKFKAENEDVSLAMEVGDSDEILNRILQQNLDLGFVGVTRKDRHLSFTPFVHDRLILVVSPQHELAERSSITFEELIKIPVILQQPGSGATSALRSALTTHGLKLEDLNVLMEAGLQESTKAAVRFGLGATFISHLGALDELQNGSLIAIDIEGLELEHDFYIAHHRDWPLSRLARRFLETARKTVSSLVNANLPS